MDLLEQRPDRLAAIPLVLNTIEGIEESFGGDPGLDLPGLGLILSAAGREAKQLANTNFIVAGRFKSHAVRDGNLIAGQQQYSGAPAAKPIVRAIGQ